MLTHLRFKNWRSLKDVEINDLTPITVFIGANSSGKTNILDALHFMRSAVNNGVLQAIYSWRGYANIHTIGIDPDEPVEVEFSFFPKQKTAEITYSLTVGTDDEKTYSQIRIYDPQRGVKEQFSSLETRKYLLINPFLNYLEKSGRPRPPKEQAEFVQQTIQYILARWQLLDEDFILSQNLPTSDSGDLFVIDRKAKNIPYILDFMHKTSPKIYDELKNDLLWLLDHVSDIDTEQTDYETRILLQERTYRNREAPTISAGTGRIITMLTAFHLLETGFFAEQPGLVVIEEPDTALNPLLLKRFMELIRSYVDGEHPRQVIMTTHNPHFLDLFQPEEVRIVERDDQGYTTVKQVPNYIKDIWLDEYGLGEVWTTRSFGGVPK